MSSSTPRLLIAALYCGFFLWTRGASPAAVEPAPKPGPQLIFDVRSYGAIGDGHTTDTKAIQAAIDACHAARGGRVMVSGGTFLTGTIYLKSNVTLDLEAGAVLLGSSQLADYDQNIPEYKIYTYSHRSLIYAEKAANVCIMGKGAIDLQGRDWPVQTKGKGTPGAMEWGQSPFGVRLVQCDNLTIRDVTIRNCPMAALRVVAARTALIDGVVIENRVRISCDGIELVSSQQVVVSNCRVNSWDDGICVKSASYDACRNITISNCVISSICNGIKLGTESTGGFENIVITNCAIECRQGRDGPDGLGLEAMADGKLGGITGVSLEIVDGGVMNGVNISNLIMKNERAAIFIRLGNRGRLFWPEQPKPGIGSLRNVMISNIQAELTDAKICCSITGEPGYLIDNVVLENLRLRFAGGAPRGAADLKVPDLPADYPESLMYGTLPAYGFYCRYVHNLKFRDVILELAKPDGRPALVFQDVDDLDISGLAAAAAPAMPALIVLNQVQGARIHGARLSQPAPAYLKVTGGRSKEILLWQNDLRPAGRTVIMNDGAPAGSVTESANLTNQR